MPQVKELKELIVAGQATISCEDKEDIVFSLSALGGLGRTDLRGKFFLRKNLKPLKYYILYD